MQRKGLRMLVAIDFSPESQKAPRAARELASRTRASLTLAHVRPHSDVRAAVVEERGDLLKGRAGTLRKAIARHYQERLESFAVVGRRETHKLLSGKIDREKPFHGPAQLLRRHIASHDRDSKTLTI